MTRSAFALCVAVALIADPDDHGAEHLLHFGHIVEAASISLVIEEAEIPSQQQLVVKLGCGAHRLLQGLAELGIRPSAAALSDV
jgi:hypothetical protein